MQFWKGRRRARDDLGEIRVIIGYVVSTARPEYLLLHQCRLRGGGLIGTSLDLLSHVSRRSFPSQHQSTVKTVLSTDLE